jgi:K+-transporting ATPase ATPase C chain
MNILRNALQMLVLMTLLTGVAYPLLVTGVTQVIFPEQANGSLLYRDDKPVASAMLAQNLTDPRYFWPRPSAGNFDGMASGGSNYGQSSPDLMQQWQSRIAQWQQSTDQKKPIPVELIQASASGLDPHISLAAAYYQLRRVAQSRGLTEDQVKPVLEQYVDRSGWFTGVPMVNVMVLNLALDQQGVSHAAR